MKVNFDLEAYRAQFTGGARSYLFFIPFTWPEILKKKEKPFDYGSTINNAISNIDGQISKFGINSSSYIESAKNTLSVFGIGTDMNMASYLVKSTNLPEVNYDEIVLKYGGISYKIAGEKSYGDWTVTLNVDSEGKILQKFQDWVNAIYDKSTGSFSKPFDYMTSNQEIHLLDYSGNTTKIYKLNQCWPKHIGEVALDYSTNEIASFSITFSYTYYTVNDSPGNNAKTTLAKKIFNKYSGMIA